MDLRVSLSGAPQCLVRVAGDHCGRHVSESVDCNARLYFFPNVEIGDEPSDLRSEPGLAEPGWFCCTLPSKYGRPCLAAAPPSQAAAACHARCQSPARRRSRAPAPLSITSNHAQFAPAWCRGNGTVRRCHEGAKEGANTFVIGERVFTIHIRSVVSDTRTVVRWNVTCFHKTIARAAYPGHRRWLRVWSKPQGRELTIVRQRGGDRVDRADRLGLRECGCSLRHTRCRTTASSA
jgi:hypothetical protein